MLRAGRLITDDLNVILQGRRRCTESNVCAPTFLFSLIHSHGTISSIDGSHSDDIPGFLASLTQDERAELIGKFSAYAEQVLPDNVACVINNT